MALTYAFIDETGNTSLETQKVGVSKYFIICAVIISESKIKEISQLVEKLRKKHFQIGEIKSSGIGNNTKRRIKILKDVADIDFKFYAIVVSKERVKKDSGLVHKKSFFKFLNGKLYSRLFNTYFDIQIEADEHGDKDFQESFKKYIDKNHKLDLFYKSQFELANSKSSVLIQLADFVAGTLGKVYEGKKTAALDEAYRDYLLDKALDEEDWPTRYQLNLPKDHTTDEFSELIYTYSLVQAEKFINKNEKVKDEEVVLQVATLRHLLFQSKFIDNKKYIKTDDLINYLFNGGHGEVSKNAFRSSIIAPLRDSEVIISSSNAGYKIPNSIKDMEDFVERVNGIVKPLLSRLGTARKNLNIASKGEIDILKGPNYPHLVDFIEILEKYKKHENK